MLGQSPQRLPGNQKCAISYRAPACLFCWFFLTGFYILLLAQHFALYRLKTSGAASPGTRSTTLLGRHWQQWGAAGGHPQQRGGVPNSRGSESTKRHPREIQADLGARGGSVWARGACTHVLPGHHRPSGHSDSNLPCWFYPICSSACKEK